MVKMGQSLKKNNSIAAIKQITQENYCIMITISIVCKLDNYIYNNKCGNGI